MRIHALPLLIISFLYTLVNCHQLISDASINDDIEQHGISIAFSEQFWENFIKSLLPQVFDLIDDLALTNQTATIDLKDLLQINATAKNLEIGKVSYDENYTRVDLLSANNTIGFHIGNSSFNFTLKYEIEMDPPLIDDDGKLEIGYENFTLDLVFGMGPNDGDRKRVYVNVTLNHIGLAPKDLHINFTNTNDFNKQLGSIAGAIGPAVMNVIEKALEENLETLVNTVSKLIPIPLVFGDISVDMSFVDIPKIDPKFTYNLFVGAMFPTNGSYPHNNTAKIPTYQENGGCLQIFISEYTLRSFIYTEYTLGNIDVTIDESPIPNQLVFDTNSFSYFLPGIAKTYGKNKKTRLRLYAGDEQPYLSMGDQSLTLYGLFLVDIEVEKEENVWETAVTIVSNSTFVGDITITGKLVLTVHIKTITAGIKDYQNSKIGNVNVNMLKSLLTVIENILKLSLNVIVGNGFDLAKQLKINVDFGKVDFTIKKGYMTFQSICENKISSFCLLQDEGVPILSLDQEKCREVDSEQVSFKNYLHHTLASSDIGLNASFVKGIVKKVLKNISVTDIFRKQHDSSLKSAYKGLKFFESILNFGNEDYETANFTDL